MLLGALNTKAVPAVVKSFSLTFAENLIQAQPLPPVGDGNNVVERWAERGRRIRGNRGRDGGVGGMGLEADEGAVRYTSSSVECGEVSGASPPRDAVLVNVRPVGPVSMLLTPG